MIDLVALAHRLSLMGDAQTSALDLAVRISREGETALGSFDDGVTLYLKGELRASGVIDEHGQPNPGRAAALVLVADMLTQVPDPPAPAPSEGRMVFTAPEEALPIPAERRLDLLVADIVRMATRELHIGSGFWNEGGVDLLLEVLRPAVRERRVATTIYAQAEGETQVKRLHSGSDDLLASPSCRILWYKGPANSLMHAKFVVADGDRGYLGTANMTSLGFSHHIEVGTELTASQSRQLISFLETLEAANLLVAADWQ